MLCTPSKQILNVQPWSRISLFTLKRIKSLTYATTKKSFNVWNEPKPILSESAGILKAWIGKMQPSLFADLGIYSKCHHLLHSLWGTLAACAAYWKGCTKTSGRFWWAKHFLCICPWPKDCKFLPQSSTPVTEVTNRHMIDGKPLCTWE